MGKKITYDTFNTTLTQDNPCSLKNIKNITEQLEENVYEKLNDLKLIAY